MNQRQHTTGFTLIELLLVTAIITIILSYSVSFYSRFIKQNAVFNASDELIGFFRQAQVSAMMGKLNASWGVNISGSTLTLYAGNSFATRNTAYDSTFDINPNITIVGMVDTNFKRMTGTPSASPTVTFSGSGSTKTIAVNAEGTASRQ